MSIAVDTRPARLSSLTPNLGRLTSFKPPFHSAPTLVSAVGLLGAVTLGGLSSVAVPVAAARAQAPMSFAAVPAAHVSGVPAASRASRGTIRPALIPLPAKKPAPRKTVTRVVPVGAPQTGIASWYGPGFAGRRSSNGETFDPTQMTAAHKWLPFGTLARVCTNSGACVVVRITDRGPYVAGRIVDLSTAAAQALGMGGLAYVTLTPITTKTVVETVVPRASRSMSRPSLKAPRAEVGLRASQTKTLVHNVALTTGFAALPSHSQDSLIGLAPLALLTALGGSAVRSRLTLDLAELPELPASK